MADLEKFIPFFPDVETNDIQLILHSMMEFFGEESTGTVETLNKLGEYYHHQKYNAQMFYINDRQFVIAVPGTGKSCLQIAAALKIMNSTSLYHRCIIATPKALIGVMEYQAVCKCTDGIFLSKKGTHDSISAEEPSKEFKEKFPIVTHHDLYLMAMKKNGNIYTGKNKDELNKEFNGTILMVDEISKMILSGFSAKNKETDDSEGSYKIEREIDDLRLISDVDDVRIINSSNKYVQLWRICHAVTNLKFMGLTGTPITNHPSEFFMLANLFLTIENQYDVSEISKRIFSLTIEDFTRLNGIISYVGPSLSVASANYMGTVIPYKHKVFGSDSKIPSQLMLYPTELYSAQAELLFKERGLPNINKSNQSIQYFVSLSGKTGFKVDLKEDNDDREEDNINIETDDLTEEATDLSSPKVRMETCSLFTEIACREQLKYQAGTIGCAYIYNKFTKTVIKPLRRLFEIYGFEVITSKELLDGSNKTTKSTSYCNVSGDKIPLLNSDSIKPRVVFMDGDIKNTKLREQVLTIMGSKENVTGKRIRILVGSKIFEMGVNIGNVETMYRICSEWNESNYEQAEKRVFRDDSSNNIRAYKAKLEGKNIADVSHAIDIFNFCPYSRYFFFERKNKDCFPVQSYIKETFGIDKKICYRFNSAYIAHLIGYCKHDELKNKRVSKRPLITLPLFLICSEGESPLEKLSEYAEISTNDELMLDTDYDMVYFHAGIIEVAQCGIDVFENLDNKILVKHTEGNSKKIYNPLSNSTYSGEYTAFGILTDDDGNSEIVEVPLLLQVVSSCYSQYMKMEKKSFPMHKVMRPAKQIAFDCIANYKRNILPPQYNRTPNCDYENCDYTCSSMILPSNSKDAHIYQEGNGEFWDNKEILYPGKTIDECKHKILGMFEFESDVRIEYIFKTLQDYREYFIIKSIIDLTNDKTPIVDRFGFQCFICATGDKIFLRRDVSSSKSEFSHFPSLNTLTGVLSDQQLVLDDSVDQVIIASIEEMGINGIEEGEQEDMMMVDLQVKLKSLKRSFASQFELLEKAYGRSIYTKNVPEGMEDENFLALPIDYLIVNYFKYYLNKIGEGEEAVYVHTFPKEEINTTLQGGNSKLLNVKTFRIFRIIDDEPCWGEPTKQELKIILPIIKEQNNKILNPDLTIIIKDESGETFEAISDYYISVNPNISKGGVVYKFVNKKKGGTGGGLNLYDSTSIDSLRVAASYFDTYVDRDYYPDFENALGIFYAKADAKEAGKVVKGAFVEMCKVLNLISSINDVYSFSA